MVVRYAYRTHMVALDKEHLDDRMPVVLQAGCRSLDIHLVGDLRSTSRQELCASLHLDDAQAASPDVAQPVEVAQRRYRDAVLTGDFQHRLAGAARAFDPVDLQGVNGHATGSLVEMGQTPAAHTRSSMCARYSLRK